MSSPRGRMRTVIERLLVAACFAGCGPESETPSEVPKAHTHPSDHVVPSSAAAGTSGSMPDMTPTPPAATPREDAGARARADASPAPGLGGSGLSTDAAPAETKAVDSGGPTTKGNIVEYHIPEGTGRKAWPNQSKDRPIFVPVGSVLRVFNDDSTAEHTLHTFDQPCPHGPFDGIKRGSYYDCPIKAPFTTANGNLYDHFHDLLGDPQIVYVTTTAPSSSGAPGGGDSDASFTKVWSKALSSKCAGAGCHGPGGFGGLDISTQAKAYASLSKVVKSGDPAGSLLVQRLESPDAQIRMPKGAPKLPDDQLQLVRAWIAAGAKND